MISKQLSNFLFFYCVLLPFQMLKQVTFPLCCDEGGSVEDRICVLCSSFCQRSKTYLLIDFGKQEVRTHIYKAYLSSLLSYHGWVKRLKPRIDELRLTQIILGGGH